MKHHKDMSTGELIERSNALEGQLADLRTSLMDYEEEFRLVRAEIQRRQRPSPEPRLSNHALLRYLERVKGVDVETARGEIMTPAVIEAIKSGATAVQIGNTKFVVDKGCIVTTLDKAMRPKKRDCKKLVEIDDTAEQLAEAGL